MFDAAKAGDLAALTSLLDEHPGGLHLRAEPHSWTLLHAAAFAGQLHVVDELLRRGLNPNLRERGDETYAMHWAAAAGHGAIVRRLIDGGGDVIGHGDDHELDVIGWASCWDGCADDAHREIVDLLLAHGARHHVFSAIAVGDEAELRRIVAGDEAQLERPMSRNEARQRPLHFAVRTNRPRMVTLLRELGADPDGRDEAGFTPLVYAMDQRVDRPVIVALCAGRSPTLLASLALADWEGAERIARDDPTAIARDGVLHLLAKRGDARAVRWLLAHGADPSATWAHWDADVTPLHLVAFHGDVETAQAST